MITLQKWSHSNKNANHLKTYFFLYFQVLKKQYLHKLLFVILLAWALKYKIICKYLEVELARKINLTVVC